jgi:NAD(P)-dependent dehydrogenase (short-subunit alcohol dehydrogenase family)
MAAALITGSSRGIGAAAAHALAARGVRVAVHASADVGRAREVAEALPGDGHVALAGDLADPAAVQRFVDEAAAALGGLDVLVNNAGVWLDAATDGELEAWREVWRATLAVNLVGAADASFCALRHFRAAGGGRIVNVTSRGAFRGEPVALPYGASKAGLNAFGQSLAVALAPEGIAVMAVAPGFVETDMTTRVLATPKGDAIRAQSPFDRVARPEEIAETIAWLATAAPEWLSGAIVDANGASYLRT